VIRNTCRATLGGVGEVGRNAREVKRNERYYDITRTRRFRQRNIVYFLFRFLFVFPGERIGFTKACFTFPCRRSGFTPRYSPAADRIHRVAACVLYFARFPISTLVFHNPRKVVDVSDNSNGIRRTKQTALASPSHSFYVRVRRSIEFEITVQLDNVRLTSDPLPYLVIYYHGVAIRVHRSVVRVNS